MYRLEVFYPGEAWPRAIRDAEIARLVLMAVSDMLSEHPDCERVTVFIGPACLYSVDHQGKRIVDRPAPVVT